SSGRVSLGSIATGVAPLPLIMILSRSPPAIWLQAMSQPPAASADTVSVEVSLKCLILRRRFHSLSASRLMATIPSDRSDVRGRYLAGLSFGKEGAIPEEASSDAEPRPNYREIPPDRG